MFDGSGAPITPVAIAATSKNEVDPVVARDPRTGDFAIAYAITDTSEIGVEWRDSAGGVPRFGELINGVAGETFTQPFLAPGANTLFLVYVYNGNQIYLWEFLTRGVRQGTVLPYRPYTVGSPRLAVAPSNDALLIWRERSTPSDGVVVQSQIIGPHPTSVRAISGAYQPSLEPQPNVVYVPFRDSWLVTWVPPGTQRIASTFVSADTIAQADTIDISRASWSYLARVAVAADATEALVLWQQDTAMNTSDVFAHRLSSEGSVLDDSPVLISSPVGASQFVRSQPAIAYDPSSDAILSAWVDGGDVYATYADASAQVYANNIRLGDNYDDSEPCVATNGRNVFLVAWQSAVPGSDEVVIRGIFVNGNQPHSAPFTISYTREPMRSTRPAVAYYAAADRYLVTWEATAPSNTSDRSSNVWLASVGLENGTPFVKWQKELVNSPAEERNPAIAVDDKYIVVAYETSEHNGHDSENVNVVLADPSNGVVVLDTLFASQKTDDTWGPRVQRNPTIAGEGSGSGNFLVAFSSLRKGDDPLFASDIELVGLHVSGRSLVSGTASLADDALMGQDRPSLCWDGRQFVMAWESEVDGHPISVWGRFENSSAQVDRSQLLSIAASRPAIACVQPDTFVTVYEKPETGLKKVAGRPASPQSPIP